MNDKGNKRKTVPSWTWWIVAVFVAAGIFTKTVVLTKKKTTRLEKIGVLDAKAKTQEVIVLKLRDEIVLDINSQEWSPWIDATHSNIHYYAHAENGLIFKFRNGEIKKVLPGNVKNFGSSSYLFMFKLKSVSKSDIAVIETDGKSVVQKYIN